MSERRSAALVGGLAVSIASACTPPPPPDPPTVAAAPVEPAVAPTPVTPLGPATPATPAPATPPEPERADAEWVESPIEADLDGDGKPESIRFTCGSTLSVTIGRAKATEKVRISELVGCLGAVVDLRPGGAMRHVVFTVDEHEEVGPDTQFLFAYQAGKAKRIWSEVGDVTFFVDGSWVTESTDCDDAAGFITTTTRRHRLSDGGATSVTTTERLERTAVAPGGCADP